MPYVQQSDLLTYFSAQAVIKFLDDDGDGSPDAGLLEQIVQDASMEVDGRLNQTYTVPFADPAPVKVRAAALVFTCEAFYQRRNVPPDRNPFTARADYWRIELDKIGRDGKGLDNSTLRVVPPVTWASSPSWVNDTTL